MTIELDDALVAATGGGALAGTEKIAGVDGAVLKTWLASQFATYVTAIIVDSAPSTLDTLNELAAALGDDPNFATTVTNALAGKQPLDADLTALAALTTTSFGRSVLETANASALRILSGSIIGSDVQAFSSVLATYAGINPSANVQSVLGAADYAAIRTLLGLVVGTNVQAYDADLAAIAGVTSAADKVPYFTGSGTAGVADFNALGRSLLGASSARAICALLGTPYVLAQTATAVSHTGDTSVTTLATITIPANALGPSGQVEVIALASGTSNANNKTLRIVFNAAANYYSASFTTATLQAYARIANRTTGTQVGQASGATTVIGIVSGAPAATSVDTTASTSITITGQLANSADTITLESYIVKVTYGA